MPAWRRASAKRRHYKGSLHGNEIAAGCVDRVGRRRSAWSSSAPAWCALTRRRFPTAKPAPPLDLHQPGVFGVALGQGLILAALLALTAPVTGGYLNPAIVVMRWVFGHVDCRCRAWLIGAQFLGSILAAFVLYFIFRTGCCEPPILARRTSIRWLINSRSPSRLLTTGAVIELLLTFFLVFAIFGLAGSGDAEGSASSPA